MPTGSPSGRRPPHDKLCDYTPGAGTVDKGIARTGKPFYCSSAKIVERLIRACIGWKFLPRIFFGFRGDRRFRIKTVAPSSEMRSKLEA